MFIFHEMYKTIISQFDFFFFFFLSVIKQSVEYHIYVYRSIHHYHKLLYLIPHYSEILSTKIMSNRIKVEREPLRSQIKNIVLNGLN